MDKEQVFEVFNLNIGGWKENELLRMERRLKG